MICGFVCLSLSKNKTVAVGRWKKDYEEMTIFPLMDIHSYY